jgi:deazaflavin-dependent oxidoreductase (nitroreductase family)
MVKRVVKSVVGLAIAATALWIVFTVSMRTKYPPVLMAIRRISRVFRRQAMRTAGRPGAYASVIQHFGRTTGTPYETPVGAVATDDGFVIALPYGTRVDWLRNVQAAGSAIIVNEGNTYKVDHPELVPSAVANPYFPNKDQRLHRLYGVNEFLRVQRVVTQETQEQTATPV